MRRVRKHPNAFFFSSLPYVNPFTHKPPGRDNPSGATRVSYRPLYRLLIRVPPNDSFYSF